MGAFGSDGDVPMVGVAASVTVLAATPGGADMRTTAAATVVAARSVAATSLGRFDMPRRSGRA
ncbi:hypothetical protein Ate02nite_50780 [Paractinoplanes tereljensis]|uniref:Uncharacterized protein n=1 Tax=Paractinoplanes tereljensis TaxID=571912 RepID=A0A919NQ94_9ACTN|nr:hypothetical protein Ate02nite_50780 [Actinoplanes tereljensis]